MFSLSKLKEDAVMDNKLIKENEALKNRLEDAKKYFNELKQNVELTEIRTKAQLMRNTQKTRDELSVLRTGLETCIAERKTSITQMNNFLSCINAIIDNLKENGLWE
jgi:predicted nuclease with TOPRIM domain